MKFMLDTNVLMHIANQEPGYRNILKQLNKHEAADVVLSAITAHELHYKIQKQRIGKARIDDLSELMQPRKVIPFNNKAAEVSALLRVHLENCGTKISYWDTLIAGHAKALDLVCVTDNVGEYDRVPGLQVENWLRPK
jgi:tRNA(fMet)-specific endonuclease VapC